MLQQTKWVNYSPVFCHLREPRRKTNVIMTTDLSRFEVAITLLLRRVYLDYINNANNTGGQHNGAV